MIRGPSSEIGPSNRLSHHCPTSNAQPLAKRTKKGVEWSLTALTRQFEFLAQLSVAPKLRGCHANAYFDILQGLNDKK
jgi:hypothetical protein